MSFFDAYEGTERIDFDGGFWIDVKKCLTDPEYQQVEARLGAGKQTLNMSGARLVQIDPAKARETMLFLAITAWNIDDKDGILPLEPDAAKKASIARLPSSVTMRVYQFCDELYGPRDNKDAAQFPGEGVGGDPDGDDPAA